MVPQSNVWKILFLSLVFCLAPLTATFSAGLSETQYKRIHGKAGWKPDDISDRKAHLLENLFLVPANDFFSDKEALPIYLVASVDSNSKVSRKGEDGLRRITTTGLEEKSVIDKLFQLVLGTQGNVAAADKRSQALPALRAKSMEYLSRSTAAANAFPLTLQTVFECFFGPSTTPKLKQQGLSFLQMVMRNAGDIQLKMMGAVLLTGVMKLLAVIKQDDSSGVFNFDYYYLFFLGSKTAN
jgi:proteasome component ECM29